MTNKKKRLGRGLEALLGGPINEDIEHEEGEEGPVVEADYERDDHGELSIKGGGATTLDLDEIDENPFQPRRDFSESEIVSLSESLKEHDLLQPVIVRQVGDRYQLISGERRLRAARLAGWEQIPAHVREADDRLVAELAIVENLQRKDLNAIEKALSFQRYIQQHGCTQEDLAGRLKINRATIANLIRLLELPDDVQEALGDGRVSAGHARALLPLGDDRAQVAFAKRIEEEGLSVRETERQVQEQIRAEDGEPLSFEANNKAKQKHNRSEQISALEQDLKAALGTKVDIRESAKGRGKITVHFKSHDEFERLFAYLTENEEPAPRRQAG